MTFLRYLTILLCSLSLPAIANQGPFGIDHKLPYNNNGIWSYQKPIMYTLQWGTVGGALLLGSKSRVGRTFWASLDALAIGAGVTTQVIKRIFSRKRPRHSNNPNDFFKGYPNQSFVSGDVASYAAVLTPWILEYGEDYPLTYLLGILPIYDAVARMKVQAHWQSDVIGGLLVGGVAGYWAHQRDTPLLLFPFKDGAFVGLYYVF